MGIYESMMQEITSYTGLSPAAFFTIAFMMIVAYRYVTAMFVSAEDYNKPPVVNSDLVNNYFNNSTTTPTSSAQLVGDMTEQELRGYNGTDPSKPILIAIKGVIYDVSSGMNFYGPGGGYAMFAGREASRALALLSFKPQDINGNLEGLGDDELQVLQDWEDKFVEKYPKVGRLIGDDDSHLVSQETERS